MNERNAYIKEEGLKELANLAWNDENKVAILKAGGINLILSAMKTHSTIANVQYYACGLFGALAFEKDYDVATAETGVITTILSALKNHKSKCQCATL